MPPADTRDAIIYHVVSMLNIAFTKTWTAFLSNPTFLKNGPIRAVTARQLVNDFGRDVVWFSTAIEFVGSRFNLSFILDAEQMSPLLRHLMHDDELVYEGTPSEQEISAVVGLVTQGLKVTCRRLWSEDKIEFKPGTVNFKHVVAGDLDDLAMGIGEGLLRVAQSGFEVFGHEGSVMVMVWPMDFVDALNTQYTTAKDSTEIQGWLPTPTATLKVIVADGSDGTRSMIQDALEIHRVQVLAVRDGEEAMRQIEKTDPDLVICDPGLPRLDGPSLARWLRSRSQTGNVPIAFCGAMPRRETLLDHVRSGMNEFIVRPPDAIKIRALLEKYLPEAVV